MTGAEIALAIIGLGFIVFWLVWFWAQRLDRLHKRVATARVSLGRQLTARAVAALDLAHAAVLDPVSSIVLIQAAHLALESIAEDGGPAPDSGPLQSELSATARFALGGPGDVAGLDDAGRELVDHLAAAWYRVTVSLQFYNEAVGQTRRLRSARPVRWLRLAGYTPMPQYFTMDDAWPEDLPQPGG
jgi:hypothetical protein